MNSYSLTIMIEYHDVEVTLKTTIDIAPTKDIRDPFFAYPTC